MPILPDISTLANIASIEQPGTICATVPAFQYSYSAFIVVNIAAGCAALLFNRRLRGRLGAAMCNILERESILILIASNLIMGLMAVFMGALA